MSTTKIDRTNEPYPLIIDKPTDMAKTNIIDNNLKRPGIMILPGGSLKLNSFYRQPLEQHVYQDDASLDSLFSINSLPRIQITASHHDARRSAVWCMGTFQFTCNKITAGTCVLVTAAPNGEYGVNSVLKLGTLTGCRFGVLATGQRDFTCTIKKCVQTIWEKDDAEIGGGHAFYANESYKGTEFLRLRNCKVRIGQALGVPAHNGLRVNASMTAKFKGSYGVDYECLDDQNPCGALDVFQASGVARINWKHPGVDAQNTVAIAYRLGYNGQWGDPDANFGLTGKFDHSLAPNQLIRSAALHMTKQFCFLLGVEMIGASRVDAYGVVNKWGLKESAL